LHWKFEEIILMKILHIVLNLFCISLSLHQASFANALSLPDGDILYYEETARGKGNLMLMELNSGRKTQVGRSGTRADHFPNWSPDGRLIAFESYRKGGWHVWVSDANGQNARRLSNLPAHSTSSYEFDPGFSVDNHTLVFSRLDELFTVTLSDPRPKQLTPSNNGISETAPVYSPDGQRIAIMGYSEKDLSWDIYTMGKDGSDFKRLTYQQGRNLAPYWSPDGQCILFYSDRNGSFELYEININDNFLHPIFNQQQLDQAQFKPTKFVDPWDNDWGATEQYRASYSPDGSWIAFSRVIDGDRELFISRRDGSQITRITFRPGLDASPMWRPQH
jgi:Tol biopolymer transport system component